MNPFLWKVLEAREREMAEGEEPVAADPAAVREFFAKDSYSFRRLGKMEELDPKLINRLRVRKWRINGHTPRPHDLTPAPSAAIEGNYLTRSPWLEPLLWGAALGFVIGLGTGLIVFVGCIVAMGGGR